MSVYSKMQKCIILLAFFFLRLQCDESFINFSLKLILHRYLSDYPMALCLLISMQKRRFLGQEFLIEKFYVVIF
jgi:hypothetical protein